MDVSGDQGPEQPVDLSSTDVPCRNCGFNLRGLSPDGNCPECGSPVLRSIRGDLLVHSGTEYLRALYRGLVCILIAAIAQAVVLVLTVVLAIMLPITGIDTPSYLDLLRSAVSLPLSALTLYGWWLFSTPDPALRSGERGEIPRRIVRAATVILAVGALADLISRAYALGSPGMGMAADAISSIASLAGIVQFFASLLYVRWIAPRLPSPEVGEKASRYLWMLPLIYILGACVFGLGPLIAVVLYFLLLNEVRVRLKSIQVEQAAEYGRW